LLTNDISIHHFQNARNEDQRHVWYHTQILQFTWLQRINSQNTVICDHGCKYLCLCQNVSYNWNLMVTINHLFNGQYSLTMFQLRRFDCNGITMLDIVITLIHYRRTYNNWWWVQTGSYEIDIVRIAFPFPFLFHFISFPLSFHFCFHFISFYFCFYLISFHFI
jgi:hypothetical protein